MPNPIVLPAAQPLQPGLWLAQAALAPAAEWASALCPAAIALATAHYPAASRRQAFLAGRAVAATALAALRQHGEVSRAVDGAPCWPAGVVGSIAHDGVQAVALVGLRTQWQALGVDVEPDLPLPEDAASVALRPEDETSLLQHFGREAQRHSRLVFCAKECVHKALHPLRGAWLEFEAVRIEWHSQLADGGAWQALPVSAEAQLAFAGLELRGHWRRRDGALLTWLAISA